MGTKQKLAGFESIGFPPEIQSDQEITADLSLIGNLSLAEEAVICSRHNNSRVETNCPEFM